ncbi:2-oxoglutarate and iron-dependent oxygenase domain-containing protein 3-like [Plodia interpunctella]|uniref:2-oxoglutarate and iron-dependent oxygenase domain-containing protein 3-like n=1 Tax=Plodia interpunctella TaxID=58824 RepID=UPI0023682F46|nr:2-oxoglutarate and iron-dependent oxygenase domain-containing protein 3-like [Plodia interpunctella]
MQEFKNRNKNNDGDVSEKKSVIKENVEKVEEDPRPHPPSPDSRKIISLNVLSRAIVITSLLIVVYFSSKDDKMKIFARHTVFLAGKGQILECSLNYLKDIDKYEGCFPKECKRFVTDKVISPKETEELLVMAKKGFQQYDSTEGITTLDLDSGALTNGVHNVNIYQNKDKSAFWIEDFNLFRNVKEKVKFAIVHHFAVEPSKIFLTRPALFMEIKKLSSEKSKTFPITYWQPHVDNDFDNSYHFTAVLYLSNYNKDFKGGRFVFVDENVNKTIEPRKSRLNMFTSGGENRYYIEKVTSGIKYIVMYFFTCDKQYAIEDPKMTKYLN